MKRYMHLHVHRSIIYNCQDMETIWAPTDRWMDKETIVYNVILLNHKKEQNFAICSNMDGPGGHYAKSQRKINTVWYHLHVESSTN